MVEQLTVKLHYKYLLCTSSDILKVVTPQVSLFKVALLWHPVKKYGVGICIVNVSGYNRTTHMLFIASRVDGQNGFR